MLLFVAFTLFLYSQIFSLGVVLGLAFYHLAFIAKTRHWLLVAAAGAFAGLMFLPWFSTLLTGTAEIVGGEFGDIRVLSPVETVTTILSLSMNASVLFLGVLALSIRQLLQRDSVPIAFWTILIVAIAFYLAVNQVTGAIDLHRSRYFVVLFPLIILLLNIALAPLRRWKLVYAGTIAILDCQRIVVPAPRRRRFFCAVVQYDSYPSGRATPARGSGAGRLARRLVQRAKFYLSNALRRRNRLLLF